MSKLIRQKVFLNWVQKTKPLQKGAIIILCSHYLIIVLFKNTLPHIFYSFSGLNHCITSVLGKQVPKKKFFLPLICNNHTGFLAFRMFSAVCCGVWLELSNQKPIRGVVCILLNTNSMYTERYKEWEGFRRSWHCRKIQKFRFSHNAYLWSLVRIV